MNAFITFLLCAIPVGVTFLFGAVGEIIVEKVGHLNLGIPGIMCMGGTGGCLALYLMSYAEPAIPPVLVVVIAILASFLTGALMGLLYSFLTVSLKSNQNVTGLVMTIFGVGLTYFLMNEIPWAKTAENGKVVGCRYALEYFRYPFYHRTDSWQYFGCMVFLGIGIALLTSFILNRTRIGLNMRAVGENPATADAVGINVNRYKYVATCIGCGIAALGGLFYIMDYSGSQESYKSIEPMGWLAVALVIFTLWKPIVTIFGSIIFGALYIASSYLPIFFPEFFNSAGLALKPLLKMIPYVVTIIVLIVTSIRNKKENQPPASLGLPYFREER